MTQPGDIPRSTISCDRLKLLQADRQLPDEILLGHLLPHRSLVAAIGLT
jgi:hypothetical protein